LLPPGYAALVALIAGSGLRIDEARHLDPADIEATDERRGFVTVTPKDGWQPKSYRFRTVPISRATCDAALRFIEIHDTVRLDNKATWTAIRKVREDLQLPKFSMHDLRRAWASAMHANGASVKQVSVWLGHSSIQVTERYIRVFDSESTGHEFLPR
jgi:integrase